MDLGKDVIAETTDARRAAERGGAVPIRCGYVYQRIWQVIEEFRTWGSPGCGKTTWIANEATKLAEIYGPDQVSICSLTNAAVREAISRDIPINVDNLTTLHARCKRVLQAPPPAEAYMKDFAAAYPSYATTRHIPIHRRDGSTREELILSSGFTVYDEVQVARQRMIPEDAWRPDMRDWYHTWSRWCIESGLMDYTSWLEVVKEMRCLPPQVIVFVDEAQDHTPLQLAVIRSWSVRYLVLVGDDDQSLYEWSGSVPEEFLKSDIPEDHNRVLQQSYRVPRFVYDLAMSILSRISHRKIKPYDPVNFDGLVESSNFSLSDSKEALMPSINDGQEHMVLASCSYMLDGIIRNLRESGIPFHNPYRRSNLRWNPLSTEAAMAIRGYLVGEWTGRSVLRWMSIMSDGVFDDIKGLVSMCENSQDDIVTSGQILPYLSERTARDVLSRKPESLLRLRRKSVQGAWDYYMRTFDKDPKVIVGTVHSVKGGEADCVHIFPDLSSSGYMDMVRNLDRIHRMFYVAVTRARHSVTLHDPGNCRYVYPIRRAL